MQRAKNCPCTTPGSINDGEAAVWFGERGGQAPWLEALSVAFVGDRCAFAVVKLPGNGAAFVPTGAFGPGEKDFAAGVADGNKAI